MQYIIKRFEAKKVQENNNSQFLDYQFPFIHASLGISIIEGRYPQTGYDVDEQVEASWYVEKGRGIVWIAGQELNVEKGDMLYIPAGEKYWIKGENLKLIVCSSPPWYPEQHKHIEE